MFIFSKIDKLINSVQMSRKGITIQDIAKEMGISISTLNKIKSGLTSPSVDTVEIIALYFGVDMNYFFSGMNSETIKHEEVKVTEVNTEFLLDRIEKQAIRINKLEEELSFYKTQNKSYSMPDVQDYKVAETPIELKKK